MSLTRYFTPFCLFLAMFSAVGSAHQDANIQKRSPLFESRQECQNAGWVPICPGFFKCVPPGGICCSDGVSYALPPETCPDGTQPLTTAVTGPPSSTITSAATTSTVFTQTAVSYTFFTTEYTWYYWYYYLTYIAIYSSTATTSSQVTTATTVSVSATDSAQADVLFSSLSATLSFPTPTQTSLSLSGSAPSATAPPPAATATAPPPAPTTATTEEPNASSSPVFTGAAVPLRAGIMMPLIGAKWAMGVLILVPGLLMVWL